MDDQVTISREVLETLVEAAQGCGSSGCWWSAPPKPGTAAWGAAVREALEYAALALEGAAR